uniref:Uncharacterized protein n=1 Tax=Arundo donax TaxID=35708 RepID=A0A0A9GXA1_ARUDO
MNILGKTNRSFTKGSKCIFIFYSFQHSVSFSYSCATR